MISKFLNAKHWQLFLLIFGLPIVFQIVLMVTMFANLASTHNPDPSFMFNYMLFYPIIMIVFMGLQYGWFWSMAIGLQDKIPQNIKMKVKKFKIFFYFPLIYMCLLCIFMGILFNGISLEDNEPNVALMAILLICIIPIHLFAMFCMFYSIYFVAKTIKTVELQREVKFGDFVGEFFMIWFYPIGIWIIQPKVNKMIEL